MKLGTLVGDEKDHRSMKGGQQAFLAVAAK